MNVRKQTIFTNRKNGEKYFAVFPIVQYKAAIQKNRLND